MTGMRQASDPCPNPNPDPDPNPYLNLNPYPNLTKREPIPNDLGHHSAHAHLGGGRPGRAAHQTRGEQDALPSYWLTGARALAGQGVQGCPLGYQPASPLGHQPGCPLGCQQGHHPGVGCPPLGRWGRGRRQTPTCAGAAAEPRPAARTTPAPAGSGPCCRPCCCCGSGVRLRVGFKVWVRVGFGVVFRVWVGWGAVGKGTGGRVGARVGGGMDGCGVRVRPSLMR